MKTPNGYGSIIKLKGKRRKPYQVRITKGYTDTGKQVYQYLGYFETQKEAMVALAEFNANPYDIELEKITFKEVYKKWSENTLKK